MKKSKISDTLQDLANEIMKGNFPSETRSQPQRAQAAPVQPRARTGSFVKSMGPGGLVFDFGHMTGNPCADNATQMINMFMDPVQESIAKSQAESINRAFVDYTRLGEHAYEKKMNLSAAMVDQVGVHSEWNTQLNKSLDQQVVELVQREGVGEQGGGRGQIGDFNKSTMVVAGEQIVGQSETDAAVIEMMKSMGSDLSGMDDDDYSEG